MKSLAEIRAELEAKYPVLTEVTNGEEFELSAKDRKETLDKWADNLYAKEVEGKASEDKLAAKAAIADRLGLTADELATLLA
tara:strand:- start:93 stop:338 length:246 start_codon:yes stop_codon:yes gene_type:complete